MPDGAAKNVGNTYLTTCPTTLAPKSPLRFDFHILLDWVLAGTYTQRMIANCRELLFLRLR